jgi:Protein of unknown function (DUF559)
MSNKVGKYPIVKYPTKIEQKLKDRSKPLVAQVEVIDGDFGSLFPAPPPRKAKSYPQYLLWGLLGCWAFILAGVVTKIASLGLIVAAVVASVVAMGFAGKQLWADSKIVAVRTDRSKVISSASEQKQPKVPMIDWSENVREIVLSNKTSSAQVGVSEKRFLEQMEQHFPGYKISFGHVYLPEGYNHPYSADIEIILPCGLRIQVEVDEPYVGKSREPHHCWDNDKDTKRDRYFTKIGWIIIRFSEKQIVTDPNGCCGAIATLIFQLTRDVAVRETAKLAKTLKPDPQWTAQQSAMMEKLKTREKYLSVAGLWNDNNGKKK